MKDGTVSSVLATLTGLPGVEQSVAQARDACTELRWHNALRRRVAEAAVESRVRGAWGSGELDGARLPLATVRDVMRGASRWHEPPDPVERVMRGAAAATAETERLREVIGTAPMQVLARLHAAAVGADVPMSRTGRPRRDGEESAEFANLGSAPDAAAARLRLHRVREMVSTATGVPIVVVAAVAHAEIVSARPFAAGNGIVARAFERVLLHSGGLDPTGVAVPEVGHSHQGGTAYFGALAAYQRGDAEGVGLWIAHCGAAYAAGAREGTRIADAVAAGRLS